MKKGLHPFTVLLFGIALGVNGSIFLFRGELENQRKLERAAVVVFALALVSEIVHVALRSKDDSEGS